LFFISLLGAYLNWLFCSFAAFFQTGLVVIITVVEPPHPTTPHPADTARLACHPSPGRAASHSLVCEQMDVVTVDAVTAFIIVYTLFFVSCFTDKSFSFEPLVPLCCLG